MLGLDDFTMDDLNVLETAEVPSAAAAVKDEGDQIVTSPANAKR